ncbi:MAG: VOC family protein [Anaerolineae bacterium]|nr:VOC family protein [Anaerolineae bacterium]MDW8098722.1 VOC family protein [Anaerolineae bacterium]
MTDFRLHPRTRPAAVALTVINLLRMLDFYQRLLGLRLHRHEDGMAVLGAGGPDLLYLVEDRTARRYRGTSGLYHFAVLLPDRRELARAIARLIRAGYPNAPTDHVMTKTTYLDDPEGNGIELYCESPEDGEFIVDGQRFYARWADGRWSDGREPLDLHALFAYLRPDDDLAAPMPPSTRIGHVHLHVGNLDEAMRFYHEVLGFDHRGLMRLFRMGMVSVDGYHHHIGFNTWQGEDAPSAPPNAAGLRWFSLALPDEAAREAVLANVRRHGLMPECHELGWQVRDPSGNRIVLTVNPEVAAAAT